MVGSGNLTPLQRGSRGQMLPWVANNVPADEVGRDSRGRLQNPRARERCSVLPTNEMGLICWDDLLIFAKEGQHAWSILWVN